MNVSLIAMGIFSTLNRRGAGLGTFALPIIEKALEENAELAALRAELVRMRERAERSEGFIRAVADEDRRAALGQGEGE